jgi:RecA-family ATPase
MSGAATFEDDVFGPPPDNDLPELPESTTEAIASWERIIHNASGDKRGIFQRAAIELARLAAPGPPEIAQIIFDSIYDLAAAAGLDDDEAQQFMADARLAPSDARPGTKQSRGINGSSNSAPLNEPPTPSPDDYGATVPATIDERPLSIAPALLVTPAQWPQEAPPPVDWLAAQRIPRGDVTSLHGDGGAGKTDIALRLAANVARGAVDWLGHEIANGPVVFVSAEEPEQEIRRRLWQHRLRDGYSLDDLTALHHWFPEKNNDTVLATPNHRTGVMLPTRLMHALAVAIEAIAPVLVVADNVAATFAGNQNDRVMVRSYVNLWRAIAHGPSKPAVLLLDHPSLSGLTNGTGRGGNMDWRNAVRSALYLHTPTDKAEADRGIRILETVKSNYGPPGNPIRLQWAEGGLQLEQSGSPLHRLAKDQECEQIFLRLLDERNAQGSHVGRGTSGMYAPKEFADTPNNGGFTKHAFAKAMQRLFTAGTIKELWDGKRRHNYIERAALAPEIT